MADTPVDVTSATVDTDDLDSFNSLLYGKAEPTGEAETTEAEDTDEDITPADDSSADEHEDTEEATESTEEDEATEDEDEEDEGDEKPEPKRRPNARERINELTAEKYAEKRRADALEIELAKLKESQKPRQEEKTVKVDNRPAPDDLDDKGELKYPMGEFDPDYISALMKYEFGKQTEEFNRTREEEKAKAEAEAEANALNKQWEEKLAKAEEGIEDLRPTIATLEHEFADLDDDFGVYLAETIMGMDLGPEVLFYLANNLDEARKVTAAGHRGATIALGKIEARIEAAINGEKEKKAAQPRQTRAPTPPITTRGNASRTTVTPDTDDLDAFESLLFNRKK